MCSQWQYDDCMNFPTLFFQEIPTVPEELDLDDEEMEDLMQFSREYGEKELQQTIADSEKIKDKAITEAFREERSVDAKEL